MNEVVQSVRCVVSIVHDEAEHDDQSSSRSNERYLVDPASSHMLVSKIKPCMSKYTLW